MNDELKLLRWRASFIYNMDFTRSNLQIYNHLSQFPINPINGEFYLSVDTGEYYCVVDNEYRRLMLTSNMNEMTERVSPEQLREYLNLFGLSAAEGIPQRAVHVPDIEGDEDEEDGIVIDNFEELISSINAIPASPVEEIALPNAIEPNPTTRIDETSSRFSGAEWFQEVQSKEIVIAGLGGIGSYVAYLMARLRPSRIILYDDDTVDAVNLSGQLFSSGQVGAKKANAIAATMREFGNFYNITSLPTRFTSSSEIRPIMICGFDSMSSRRTFYTAWKRGVNQVPEAVRKNYVFIDGRLAAEDFQVLAIRGDDLYNQKRYEEEYLFDDSQADRTICSYKQTTFMANMIASVMINLFVNFITNMGKEIGTRDFPFLTTYDGTTMFLKTEA